MPLLNRLVPSLSHEPTPLQLFQRAKAQSLAVQCSEAALAEILPGKSERDIAKFISAWLADHGVSDFFHRPLVWFGNRTLFRGFEKVADLRPTGRLLRDDDVFIVDFAPIVEGTGCDFSVAGSYGFVPGFAEARALLTEIYSEIPRLVVSCGLHGDAVWNQVHEKIKAAGYRALTADSPYAFFGHRINNTHGFPLAHALAQRGMQTYNEFFARGVVGQLWSANQEGNMVGMWAVEPHFCTAEFGIKFEEMLVVTHEEVYWLRSRQFR